MPGSYEDFRSDEDWLYRIQKPRFCFESSQTKQLLRHTTGTIVTPLQLANNNDDSVDSASKTCFRMIPSKIHNYFCTHTSRITSGRPVIWAAPVMRRVSHLVGFRTRVRWNCVLNLLCLLLLYLLPSITHVYSHQNESSVVNAAVTLRNWDLERYHSAFKVHRTWLLTHGQSRMTLRTQKRFVILKWTFRKRSLPECWCLNLYSFRKKYYSLKIMSMKVLQSLSPIRLKASISNLEREISKIPPLCLTGRDVIRSIIRIKPVEFDWWIFCYNKDCFHGVQTFAVFDYLMHSFYRRIL